MLALSRVRRPDRMTKKQKFAALLLLASRVVRKTFSAARRYSVAHISDLYVRGSGSADLSFGRQPRRFADRARASGSEAATAIKQGGRRHHAHQRRGRARASVRLLFFRWPDRCSRSECGAKCWAVWIRSRFPKCPAPIVFAGGRPSDQAPEESCWFDTPHL
jgi:hypothetical protein